MNGRPRLGVFGGVFNPPHAGHLALAERARDMLGLEFVYWVPAGRPPHKEIGSDTPDAARLAMVEAAVAGHAPFRVWTGEIENDDVSYTIDTVREIRGRHPGHDVYFLIGFDACATLPTWKNFPELIAAVRFAVYPRGREAPPPVPGRDSVLIDAPVIDVSSSDVRLRLFSCRSARYLVPDGVLGIVEREALYAAPMNADLKAHVAESVAAAEALARRWNAPGEPCRLAALWHDAYKSLSATEAMKILESLGEEVPAEEREFRALLHGRVAARRLRQHAWLHAGESEAWNDAANAVRYHTTGRGAMSLVEEVVMVADRFGKDWGRLDEIPLDRATAMKCVLASKRRVLEGKGRSPHEDMKAAFRRYGLDAS